jgi:hypothetical protein
MHCILKGICQLHATEALQLTKVLAAAAPDVVPAFNHPFTKAQEGQVLLTKTIKQVSQIHDLLVAPAANAADLLALQEKLVKQKLPMLKFVGKDLHIDGRGPSGKSHKVDWANALVDWVSMAISMVEIYLCLYSFQCESKLRILTISPTVKITTPAIMEQIHDVIRDTATPSWVWSVPYNFGDPGAGTLKANE